MTHLKLPFTHLLPRKVISGQNARNLDHCKHRPSCPGAGLPGISASAGAILTFLLLILCLSGCRRQNPDVSASVSDIGFFFDTVVELRLNGTDDQSLIDKCFEKMGQFESLFSRTREGSDVWKINHSAGNPVEISDDTAAMIELAKHYYELSDGAFDITVAPYTEIWDFQNNPGIIPEEKTIAEARSHVGFPLLHLDGSTVTLDDPQAAIDLGGIAKGYIADRLKEYLLSQGIESGYINLGGNMLTIGTKPGNVPWNIGIRKPFAEASDIITAVKVDGLSVVTSGTYERYFEKDGTIYHHILDPANGHPVQNGLQSVTILSSSSADGDALSTSCFVLGLDRGMELAESLDGIEALFITDDGELHYSSGFPVHSRDQ